MAKASDNLFPYLHLVPAAAPASPAAGSQRLYLDSGNSNKLTRKDSAGAVTVVEGSGGVTWGSWTGLVAAGGSFGTNITEFTSPYNTVQIRRTSNNDQVEVRGMLKPTATVTSGSTLMTLPTGYRPPADIILLAGCYTTTESFMRLDIHSDGTVVGYAAASLTTTSYVTVSGVRFSMLT